MSEVRVCHDGGLLVDGNSRLPKDVSEYYVPAVRVLTGCNRLRCKSCDQWVRSGTAGVGLRAGAQPDYEALFAAQDWLALPFIEQKASSKSVRLYSCRCALWEANRVDAVDNDHDSPNDPDVPWSCAGHPLPALPAALQDLTIAANSECAEIVAKILAGSCPRPLDLRAQGLPEGPGSWLAWLYAYLKGLPVAEQLASAISDRIDDGDPLVVGRVLYFLANFPRATGFERLIVRAEAFADRVAVGYPIPEYSSSPTIWAALVARLEQRQRSLDPIDQRAIEVVKKSLLVPLASLSHDDEGPTDLLEIERQRRVAKGIDVKSDFGKEQLDDYDRLLKADRTDVIIQTIAKGSSAFYDAELRQFIADNIVAIDSASPGRWRSLMDLLSDRYDKPNLGHLIVIAGMRVLESGIARPDEFREWVKQRRAYGWVDPAWVEPLKTALEEQSKRPPPN